MPLLAAGCSGGHTGPAADSTPSPLPCHRDAAPVSESDASVLSTGTAPLAAVRYQPHAGRTVHAAVGQSITETDTTAGRPDTTRVTAQVPYAVRYAAVCGHVFTTATVYDTPQVRAQGTAAATARSRLELLDGLVVREAHDDRGRLVASSRSAPAGVDASTQQALDDLLGQLAQATVVFPEQPLGVGAVWTTQRKQAVSGFALTSTARYTVTARTAAEVTLNVRVDVGALPQVSSDRDSRVSLLGYRGTGTGSLRINLATALATSGSITLTVDQQTRSGNTQVDNRITQVVTLSGP